MEKDIQMTLVSKMKTQTPLMSKKIFFLFIPDDIVIEILSWVPAKSLLRLRWACKYWFDLITRDSDFIHKHLLHHHITASCHQNINNKSLFLLSKTPSNFLCSMNFINSSSLPKTLQFDYCELPAWTYHHKVREQKLRDHRTFVQFQSGGSCNGLIFLYSSCGICNRAHDLKYEYFIWNPSTRELKNLPRIESSEDLRIVYMPILLHGFGYDHTIDDYKVINILFVYIFRGEDDDSLPEVNINIYTLGSNSWRRKINIDIDQLNLRVSALNLYCSSDRTNDGCFFNGAVHWKAPTEIICFDIVEEEFRHLGSPDFSTDIRQRVVNIVNISCFLEVLNGCLCVVVNYSGRIVDVWSLWIMKDYGVQESWTKLFIIDSPTFGNLCESRCLNLLKPIKLCKNGGILMVLNETYLVLYNLKNEKHRWVHRIGDHKIDRIEQAYVKESYIESLVSLKSGMYLTATGSATTTMKEEEGEEEEEEDDGGKT